jgi:hypothetical protein
MEDNGDEPQQQQQQQKAEQQATDDDARRRRHLKINSVLERKEEVPLRTKNKIDVLIKEFLEILGDDIHDMICDNGVDEDYRGLDSDRDSDDEVETAIRLFPEVLSRTIGYHHTVPIKRLSYIYDGARGLYLCNLNAVLFIPLFARLAAEFGLFEEQEREGLFINGDNGLRTLATLTDPLARNHEDHEIVDNKYVIVMEKLRQMGCIRKEDIKTYILMIDICEQHDNFPEKRFRFLVEWDPTSLLHADDYIRIPLHYAADIVTIQGFRMVFGYGILYYPIKKGISLLFKKDEHDKTPFHIACNKHGRDEVMRVIEDTLIRHSSSSENSPPLNVAEALITAAIDENIHLDCVYFLLRRQPDVLTNLLLGSINNNDDDDVDGGDNNNDNDDNNDVDGDGNKPGIRKNTSNCNSVENAGNHIDTENRVDREDVDVDGSNYNNENADVDVDVDDSNVEDLLAININENEIAITKHRKRKRENPECDQF